MELYEYRISKTRVNMVRGVILTFSVIYTHASILLGATLNLIIDNMILFPGLDFVHGTYKEEARKKKQSRRLQDVLDFFLMLATSRDSGIESSHNLMRCLY